MRRAALLGATGLALMAAASPAFAADIAKSAAVARSVRSTGAGAAGAGPVVDLLSVPMEAPAGGPGVSAAMITETATDEDPISVTNHDDQTADPGEAAIKLTGDAGDVTLVNTGALVGSDGINVSTGRFDPAGAVVDYSWSNSHDFTVYRYLFDDAGNNVLDAHGYPIRVVKGQYHVTQTQTALESDGLRSAISIDNSGSIHFSGVYGIRAANPSGASVDITNSGDIVSTSDGPLHVGIFASVKNTFDDLYEHDDVIAPGDVTYNSYYQVTAVDAVRVVDRTVTRTQVSHDAGVIHVVNTGDIDMGDGLLATGILTYGDGGTTVANAGDITVGDISWGIHSYAFGNVAITNSGNIKIGNQAAGVMVTISNASLGDYRLGGDVSILNTGDISGGMTRAEAETSVHAPYFAYSPSGNLAGAYGLMAASRGTNDEYIAEFVHLNKVFAAYNEQLASMGQAPRFPIYDVPNTRLYTTSVENRGTITLKDGGRGIATRTSDGYAVAVNRGVIKVGNGDSSEAFNIQVSSAGIYNTNVQFEGHSDLYALNAAGAVIETGDDGQGIGSYSWRGNSTVVNEGSIRTGSGVVAEAFDIWGRPFDRLWLTHGVISVNDGGIGTTSSVRNSGDIEVGDLAIGIWSAGNSATPLNQDRVTSEILNEGRVVAGDNSTGLFVTGKNTSVVNAGQVRVGDRDLSGFDLSSPYSADEFGHLGYGIYAKSWAFHGSSSAVVDNRGEVTTGDNTVGVLVKNTSYVPDGNAAVLTNTGMVVTGDHSVGVRLQGVNYYQGGYYYGPFTAVGSAFLHNEGTIRVGAESTAVELTGKAAAPSGAHIENTGTIDAGTGVALRVNADNRLGSNIINTGRIVGDIMLGAGDDVLVNNAVLGADGHAVGGDIFLNGSTIDFGRGENRFVMQRGAVTFAGRSRIAGADLELSHAYFEARDGVPAGYLTIDGDVSGDFRLAVDVGPGGATDGVRITGDVAPGSAMGVLINPTAQMRGKVRFTPIVIEGDNDADAPKLAGVSGRFADTLVGSEVAFDQATGEVVVTATFGMGHMATAATAATTMAQNWWTRSVGGYERRLTPASDGSKSGLSVWGVAFQDDATVHPENGLQDVGFKQRLSGGQTGIDWTTPLAGGRFSIGPTLAYGDAEANLKANPSSARGTAKGYGLNANFTLENGLYVDASWQSMSMEIDFKTPQAATAATGRSNATANGFALETGYAFKVAGLTFAPRLEYSNVDVALDDFSSSDHVYALTGIGGRSSTVLAALSASRTFKAGAGSLTPSAGLGYVDVLEGESRLSSNGVAFANDTSGGGFQAQVGLNARYKAWDVGANLGVVDTSSTRAVSAGVSVRFSW